MTQILSLIPAAVLALLLVAFLVLLPIAIIFNYRAGMKYRAALAQQLNALRLGRMLGALGIDIDSYIASERVVDIHQHIKRCGECSNLGPCDEGLADGSLTPDSIGFCNNEQSLRGIVKRTTSPQ
jgi:hypothetical protein